MQSSSSSSSLAASSPQGTDLTTSTAIYDQESFATFKLKVQLLCHSILLGEATVRYMPGGSYNRISKLTFTSGANLECVLRTPRFVNKKSAENIKHQVAIAQHLASFLPVPNVLAYDFTVDNAIGSPYLIQNLVHGRPLELLYNNLAAEERLQVASLVADIMVRMERVVFPYAGRLVSAPYTPDRCDDVSALSARVYIAPFRSFNEEVPMSSSSLTLGNLIAALIDKKCSQSQRFGGHSLFGKSTKLRQIRSRWKRMLS